ncbi:hypothetical protein CONPUDRAFT_156868 [Coniophora puteana RWD-64-598 SS2]|uniref:Uncharacterized protein n=1 Tax=Coniophora puteana (strain RWD-64-598) TaxID=741705 RepID=A0A5M3MGF4_CONPW|nr:uncharacterized protein CONPUDRAFT_156868 [Coniophora puteana RWD-64-598 SS2]EIW77681.1 hypothetical protein CONPUDRAFT_156868 [Coniophora puteana RWD-64-598 SS2]
MTPHAIHPLRRVRQQTRVQHDIPNAVDQVDRRTPAWAAYTIKAEHCLSLEQHVICTGSGGQSVLEITFGPPSEGMIADGEVDPVGAYTL